MNQGPANAFLPESWAASVTAFLKCADIDNNDAVRGTGMIRGYSLEKYMRDANLHQVFADGIVEERGSPLV